VLRTPVLQARDTSCAFGLVARVAQRRNARSVAHITKAFNQVLPERAPVAHRMRSDLRTTFLSHHLERADHRYE